MPLAVKRRLWGVGSLHWRSRVASLEGMGRFAGGVGSLHWGSWVASLEGLGRFAGGVGYMDNKI